ESVPYLTFPEGSQLNSKHCYKSEPCQFGKYKQQPDAMLTYIHIPSWCVCKENERCALQKYDRKKKRDVSAFEAFLSVSDLFYYDSCDVM
ncbi:hypothetical protein D917_00383, partial [Trichinella nativa]